MSSSSIPSDSDIFLSDPTDAIREVQRTVQRIPKGTAGGIGYITAHKKEVNTALDRLELIRQYFTDKTCPVESREQDARLSIFNSCFSGLSNTFADTVRELTKTLDGNLSSVERVNPEDHQGTHFKEAQIHSTIVSQSLTLLKDLAGLRESKIGEAKALRLITRREARLISKGFGEEVSASDEEGDDVDDSESDDADDQDEQQQDVEIVDA